MLNFNAASDVIVPMQDVARSNGTPATLVLGPFLLDESTAILYRGTDPLPVGRRAVALLSALAKAAGNRAVEDRVDRGGVARPRRRGQQSHRADCVSPPSACERAGGQALDRDRAAPRLSLRLPGRSHCLRMIFSKTAAHFSGSCARGCRAFISYSSRRHRRNGLRHATIQPAFSRAGTKSAA
jgi:hypothetical protein